LVYYIYFSIVFVHVLSDYGIVFECPNYFVTFFNFDMCYPTFQSNSHSIG